MQRTRIVAALVLALPLLAGCYDNDPLNAPDLSTSNGLMARYVSLGNSITAGFQSAGINDSTQQRSYAVLFASRANAPFFVPSLQGRGCPPPITNNSTNPPTRVGGGTAATCDLRANERMFYVSNVAVPGATSFSPLNNLIPQANSNALTTFILGGRTQVQAMQDADPTFVTAWIGNNDVLGALTSSTNPGDPALVTPVAVFEANYGAMLDDIEATGASAALIGVGDVTSIPYASRTAIYYCLTYVDALRCQAPLPTTPDPNLAGLAGLGLWTVNVNCAAPAGLATLIPWTIALTKLKTAAVAHVPQTMDCSIDAEVVTPAELTNMQTAVVGYNSYISTQATARGMAYFDPNPTLQAADDSQVRPIPDFLPALAGQPVTFGTWFSLDGVHPSTAAHQVIADSLVATVNLKFGTSIP
ncbi:MAG TPA: SGNH/GDSL hydrolase family protein [Gemmatimonadales bacterium]|nr:SGNH/GDSL hydrolase family protein [Gemmatimonadales bacterium]